MSFATDIEGEIERIFREQWTVKETNVVPQTSSIALEKNAAKKVKKSAVLYADLSGSTHMVESRSPSFAAEIYRAYLYSAAQIIRSQGGNITAYDGDRVMAVFIGKRPRSDATITALKINYAVSKIINPALKAQYGERAYQVKHVVGVDSSNLFVARTGVRGDNDLVWVGRSANYAAKLTEIGNDDAVFITYEAFDNMLDDAKFGGKDNALMWRKRRWTQMNDMRIYSSNWWWSI